jgi:Ca2+-binding EF-hand superfamily protein
MLGSFQAADANHDGKVSLQEYQAYASQQLMSRNGRMAQRFKALSPQEQQARLKQRFDGAVADHNGFIDRKEWGG